MNEGYCEACTRIVVLNVEGGLAQHTVWHSEFGRWHQVTCKGTGLEPTEQPEGTA